MKKLTVAILIFTVVVSMSFGAVSKLAAPYIESFRKGPFTIGASISSEGMKFDSLMYHDGKDFAIEMMSNGMLFSRTVHKGGETYSWMQGGTYYYKLPALTSGTVMLNGKNLAAIGDSDDDYSDISWITSFTKSVPANAFDVPAELIMDTNSMSANLRGGSFWGGDDSNLWNDMDDGDYWNDDDSQITELCIDLYDYDWASISELSDSSWNGSYGIYSDEQIRNAMVIMNSINWSNVAETLQQKGYY